MKLVKCDESIMRCLPDFYPLLFEVYGDLNLEMYAFTNDKNVLAFFARSGNNCLYVSKEGHRRFEINSKGELTCFYGDEYKAVFENGNIKFFDAKGVEYSLYIDPLDEEDRERYGIDGTVVFSQYRKEDDTLCRMEYLHMIREDKGIYSYHTRNPYRVHLEKESSKDNDSSEYGLVSKNIQNYCLNTFEYGDISYDYVRIREEGFSSLLLNNSYYNGEAILSRFTKAKYFFGGFVHILPLCDLYKPSEVEQIVRNEKFLLEIPEEILSIYNNTNYDLISIKDFLTGLKLDNNKEDYHFVMKLKNDNKN